MTVSFEQLFQGRIFSVVRHRSQTPDGRSVVREWVRHPGAVVIVPMIDDDHVCLIRNYRVAVDESLIELPAGTLEPNEQPHQTAVRELAEETGYRCQKMQPLLEFNMSPGITDERMHLFLATDLRPGEPSPEAGEQIENLALPWDEAMAMVADGQIKDAKSLVGLLLVDRT